MSSNRISTFSKIRSVFHPTIQPQPSQTSDTAGQSQRPNLPSANERRDGGSNTHDPPQSTSSSNPTPTTPAPTFQIDWDAYGIQFRRALRRKNRAAASSWSIPLHSLVAPRTIRWDDVVITGSRNIGDLLMGFVPKVMEDRWFVYAEDVELDDWEGTEVGIDSDDSGGSGGDDVGQVACNLNDAQHTPQQAVCDKGHIPSELGVGPRRREGVRLHLHRSWTGNEIFRMDFRVVLTVSDASSRRPFDMFRDSRRNVELRGVRLSYETDGGVMNRPYTDDSAKEAIQGLYLGLLGAQVKA